MSATDEQARQTLALLAGGDLDDDDPAGGVARGLERWFAARRRPDALLVLQERGVPAAPCLRFPELLGDPQIDANSCLVEIQDDLLGPVVMAGPSIHFERTPIRYDGGAPKLGDDTEGVLARLGHGSRV